MLIRIVRLTLKPKSVSDFHQQFVTIAPKIRQVQGCKRLDLWIDASSENIVTTYSEWDSESSLNCYRESNLFKTNWAQVKLFFSAPAVAHSYYASSQR